VWRIATQQFAHTQRSAQKHMRNRKRPGKGVKISTFGRAGTAARSRARVRRLGDGGVKISRTGRRRTAAQARARDREIRVFGDIKVDHLSGW